MLKDAQMIQLKENINFILGLFELKLSCNITSKKSRYVSFVSNNYILDFMMEIFSRYSKVSDQLNLEPQLYDI